MYLLYQTHLLDKANGSSHNVIENRMHLGNSDRKCPLA